MTLPSDVLALLDADRRLAKYLLEVQVSPAFRICSGVYPVKVGSDTYTPRGWKPGSITSGNPATAGFTATIEDIDGDLELRAYTEGWTGATATLYILVRETESSSWATAWQPVTGEIVSAAGGSMFINLEIIAAAGLNSRSGLQQGDSLCRLVYKGARCKYSGTEDTCPRTFDACENRAGGDNSANFRGARFAPAPGEVIKLGRNNPTVPQAPVWSTSWSGGTQRRVQEMFERDPPPVAVDGAGPPTTPPGQQAPGPGQTMATE
jgi:hypothetical protein